MNSVRAGLAEDRGGQLIAISVSFGVLTTIAVILRGFAKRFQARGIFLDDVFLALAYLVNLCLCAMGFVMVKVGGVGRHVEFLQASKPDWFASWAICILSFEMMYYVSVCLPKIGIICLYLRIFQWEGRTRVATLTLLAVVLSTSVALVVAACFQCIPLAFWWDKSIQDGTCFDTQAFFYAQSIPGFILDVAIIALPIPTIYGLQMNTTKKIEICIILAVASFGIIASIIRASVFFRTAAFADRTWASVDLIGWSIVEVGSYVTTNCLLHYRRLATYYRRLWLGNKQARSDINDPSLGIREDSSDRRCNYGPNTQLMNHYGSIELIDGKQSRARLPSDCSTVQMSHCARNAEVTFQCRVDEDTISKVEHIK